ncbi:MAG: FG-GAP-like repeat-containing protein [Planctomycetota bacterium]|nr:FG-GAP-like repeat-containing protein [Planctomycetota bacterium]
MRRRILAIALLCLSIAGIAWWQIASSTDRLLADARKAQSVGDWARVASLAKQVQETDPFNVEAAFLAGASAAARRRFPEALSEFDKVPDDSSFAMQARALGARILLFESLELSAAEQQLRRLLELEPSHPQAVGQLAYVLGLGSRAWEKTPYLLAQIRNGKFDYVQLHLLALGDTVAENPEELERFRASKSDDPVVLLGVARQLIDKQETADAETLLRKAITVRPDLIQAHVRLGRLLLDADDATFRRWHDALPETANDHPNIWELRGHRARAKHELKAAARCYWEASRRNCNDQSSVYQLGQTLRTLGRPQDAEPFLIRSRRIEEFADAVKAAQVAADFRTASLLAEQLGLLWEACGFMELAAAKSGAPDEAAMAKQLRARVMDLPPERTIESANLALQLDLSDYPLPSWNSRETELPVAGDVGSFNVTFEDQAARVGLRFQYINGGHPTQAIEYMYEFTGGGVGVLDFDADGMPDLWLTQGCTWPPDASQAAHEDRLFRNQSGRSFADVTQVCGVNENGFSQGVTIGDFNNDGFPDVFVANIGRNRLYENNGDGTFSDVTNAAGLDGEQWTTSCLIADLNHDGWPDIYAVNYLKGPTLFTQPCKQGRCSPTYYSAEQDRLYLSLGDGRFNDATDICGITMSNGKGLGIVAADLTNSGSLSLFVANDTAPNFYFVNSLARDRIPADRNRIEMPRFTDEGLGNGLAMSDRGRAEGSMGIAVADADGDRRLDVFVTNFMDETNTFYRQQDDGFFEDFTRRVGLGPPSFRMLGFGTQFLDADLDGWPDLIVTNGHVGNQSASGVPYQMPPQFFHNIGQGKFVEADRHKVGPFFEGQYLGRGLARLDWNRDGLEDVAITHLDAPAALLTNTTSTHGHFLAIQLRATRSARDAIGATVAVKTADRSVSSQLMAGDGYHAGNERQLVFGLGRGDHEKLGVTIRWPSGAVEEFSIHGSSRILMCVEGRGTPLDID